MPAKNMKITLTFHHSAHQRRAIAAYVNLGDPSARLCRAFLNKRH
jgi:hypothetical protein